jgi:hypothetical protein
MRPIGGEGHRSIGAVIPTMSVIRIKNLFIVLFFGVQLGLAMPGLLYDRYETDGRFSWNMYSAHYQCRVKYDLIGPDGTGTPINYARYFNRPERMVLILNRSDLPAFNKYLCAVFPRRPPSESIHASVQCTLYNRQPVEFIDHDTDICAALNYGVLPP